MALVQNNSGRRLKVGGVRIEAGETKQVHKSLNFVERVLVSKGVLEVKGEKSAPAAKPKPAPKPAPTAKDAPPEPKSGSKLAPTNATLKDGPAENPSPAE